MKYCINCNNECKDEDKFCRNCGNIIHKNSYYVILNIVTIIISIAIVFLVLLFIASYFI